MPTFEPVAVDECRLRLNLGDIRHHDAKLTSYIQSGREQVEKDTGIVCATGTYTFYRTHFPAGDTFDLNSIRPVSAITSIVYTATDGTSTTWSSSEYALVTAGVVPFVRLGYGYVWPTVRGDVNGIAITATAGYASAALIPQRVKDAVLVYVHAQWLTSLEMDPKHQWNCYERIVASLARDIV